jgi:Xaa-Pro aminopeptidase
MSEKEIEKHKIAAEKLELIKNRVFELIKRNLGKISEYEVNQFILSEFKKQGLMTDKKHPAQIVAVNENSAIVHHFPKKNSSKIIGKNNLILIDIWAKLEEGDSPFADITWMAFSGKDIPRQIQRTFKMVIKARGVALKFIKKELKNKNFQKTKDIDKKVRDYFRKFGLEKYFLHGLGHSLGFSHCHGKYFRFSKKSKARLKPNIPFTIEPGLYFKSKFGVRSEIDCYVTENYNLIVTSEIQNKIFVI